MNWKIWYKIWYDDGSTFSASDGPARESPNKGVVCIASGAAKGVIKGSDWYYLTQDYGWLGTDIHGLLFTVCNDAMSIMCVRQGALVPASMFSETEKAAEQAVAEMK